MKKAMFLLIISSLLFAVFLSGCTQSLPSDYECRQKISSYLLMHSNFYDVDDTIHLGEWTGNICKIREFNWVHSEGEGYGSFAGIGLIDCNGEVTVYGT